MPRNKNERNSTSTCHKGTPRDLSAPQLRALIAELIAAEHGSNVKTSRTAIRRTRQLYEAELERREEPNTDS
jgi:hypothetical protein